MVGEQQAPARPPASAWIEQECTRRARRRPNPIVVDERNEALRAAAGGKVAVADQRLVPPGGAGVDGSRSAPSFGPGDQIEAEWLTLFGIVYEPRKDTIEVALDGLDHLIRRPREIVADEQVFELANVTIKDGDGVLHILRLRDPLMLPPPTGTD